jgi:hypothetical protein
LLKSFVIGSLALAALAGSAVFVFDPFSPLEKKIAVHVTPDDPGCTTDQPVGVRLVNQSRSRITNTAIEVTVTQVGYSRSLEHERFDTDKIIEPGADYSMCVVRPETARVHATVTSPTADTYAKYPREQLEYTARVLFASAS